VARRAPSSARLFVALELPEDARAAIVDWQGEAFGGLSRSVRLVRPAALHVTLVFLGHHPEDDVPAIREACLSELGGLAAPALTAVGVKPVPPRRPRLWAVDLDDADRRAAAVQAAVQSPLFEGGWYEPEKRPFWPHLTVARLRARERPPRVAIDPPPVVFVASEVVLYRSRLSRAGADYEPLARFALG
jgi:RNA 2',3'-cyclic 3'-phosphodiesterase